MTTFYIITIQQNRQIPVKHWWWSRIGIKQEELTVMITKKKQTRTTCYHSNSRTWWTWTADCRDDINQSLLLHWALARVKVTADCHLSVEGTTPWTTCQTWPSIHCSHQQLVAWCISAVTINNTKHLVFSMKHTSRERRVWRDSVYLCLYDETSTVSWLLTTKLYCL